MARRCSNRRSWRWPAFAALCIALPAGAEEGERAAGLSARLSLFDTAGKMIARPESDTAFRLRVDIADVLTGRPAEGLKLEAWLRPRTSGDFSCREAARAFRGTGRMPQGAVDLNGTLIAVLNEDGNFSVVDPKLNLRSSNMIAAAGFDRRADAMALDRGGMRALLVFGEEGRIDAVSLADGAVTPFGPALAEPTSLAVGPTGDIWVGESGSSLLRRLTASGEDVGSETVGPGTLTVRPAGSDGTHIGAFSSGGGIILADGVSGEVVFRGRESALADVAFLADTAVLALPASGKTVILRYVDDPQNAVPIAVGFDFQRIVASPDGQFVIAYTVGSPWIAVIDVALARVVQSFGLTKGAAVSEVAFSERGAYLISHDGGYAGAIDVAKAVTGETLEIRPFNLASRSDVADPRSRLLVFFGEGREAKVMAVDPLNKSGKLVHEAFALGGAPPMEAVGLNSGIPFNVQTVDRSFSETAPGRFETTARIAGGAHELVLTSGVGGLTTCLPIDVEGPEGVLPEPFAIEVRSPDGIYRAGREQEIAFILSDVEGREIDLQSVDFLVLSMNSSWRADVTVRRSPGEPFKAKIRFPHAGPFTVQPINVPYPLELRQPALLEVKS